MKTFRGMTWSHTRGAAPLWVASVAYEDFHPDVKFEWNVRSFKEFGEGSIDQVLRAYDFLLVDHPFIGYAAKQDLALQAEDYLDESTIRGLAAGSIGRSWESYRWEGRQLAIPVDAACQVSAWREDIFEKQGLSLPQTIEEAIEFVESTGRAAMPMKSMGLLCAFLTICANLGKQAFHSDKEIVDLEAAETAIALLRRLAESCHPDSASSYPADLFRKMSTTDEIWYLPITFGYSVYSLDGYAQYPITFAPVPASVQGGPRGGTIGGVGLAISRHCTDPETAFDFAAWVGGATCQSTLYAYAGGQPAHGDAWSADRLDTLYRGFFSRTRESLQSGFLRPRYANYHEFQSLLGERLHELVFQGGNTSNFWNDMNRAYLVSLNNGG